MFENSQLPKTMCKHIDFDFGKLDDDSYNLIMNIMANLNFFVKNGYNLFLYGLAGGGKTSLAIKIMNSYFSEVSDRSHFDPVGLYINVPKFLIDYKFYMMHPTKEWREYLNAIETCDIVVWDDIYQVVDTKFESTLIYSYINIRIFAKRSNIFTTNADPEIIKRLDPRIYSRICSNSDCIKIVDNKDRRSDNIFSSYIKSISETNDNVGGV
jgi:DNA replication protein DnaC